MEYILSKFSHELRNPLTTVYSTLQFIEAQHPEVKEFKYWSNLARDLEYMNYLLTELSDYSKSETLNISTFSLKHLLEYVCLSFAASAANSEIQFSSKICPSINQITGDKTKIQEVFFNLLKNAFDAAKPNKAVRFEASLLEDKVLITVHDDGCGITEEQMPTIFDPFVTYKKNGSGLGLAICKNIVKAHGGVITVESLPNMGTTFFVYLPLSTSV